MLTQCARKGVENKSNEDDWRRGRNQYKPTHRKVQCTTLVKECADFEKFKPFVLYAILEQCINSRNYVTRRKGDLNVELGGVL
jgi:hypothetical protein